MPEAYVLIVDDDKLILDLVSLRLEAAGFNVTTAADAWQEVIQAHGLKVGLVITDIQMPGFGTGVDAFKRLREASPNLPVIFMSGMKPEDALAIIPKDPRVRFLPKPINFDDLRKFIKELTGVDRVV
jgi:DNA-binding NtrC family response regulator